MSPQQYFDTYHDESLLYNTKDPTLRGQCVQAVCFYVVANGKPVLWDDAVYWFTMHMFPNDYDYIENTAGAVPQAGDVIIWGSTLPGSGGAGHIAVVLQVLPGTGTFISVDQNWGGKTVHKVTHNYDYVVGWIRFKSAAPAVAQAEGDEMIANEDQTRDAYALLRGTRDDLSQDELNATAGHRTWAGFAVDARPEIAAREAAKEGAATALTSLQGTINSQNATITDLTTKLTDATSTAAEKQAALTEALTKIASDNASMATTHDTITDLNAKVAEFQNNPIVKAQDAVAAAAKKPSPLTKLIATVISVFSKKKS